MVVLSIWSLCCCTVMVSPIPFLIFKTPSCGFQGLGCEGLAGVRCFGTSDGGSRASEVMILSLVAEWIHFTLFGILLPTIKLKVYTFWGL